MGARPQSFDAANCRSPLPVSNPRALLFARAFYFLFFGAVGSYVPFINLYFEQNGLSGTAIGTLAALGPLVLLFSGPLWGAIGDRFRIHRYLLPLAVVGPIVPALLMLRTGNFSALAALMLAGAFFSTAVTPLIDSAVLDLVQDTPHSYGSIRVWGSVGYTLAAWLMGNLLKAQGLRWLFYGYALALLIAALISLGLPARRQSWQTSFRASVSQLVRQRPLALFFAGSFLVGAALQASYAFFPLHLMALGGNPAWVGLASALGATSEIPVLYFSGLIFGRLGVRNTVILGYLTFAVRWAVVALVTSPVLAVLTTSLHGLSFGPFLTGGVAFVETHTPAGLHATAQALLTAMCFGLGAAVGALCGGLLYDTLGASGLFGVASVTMLVAAGFVVLAGKR